MDVVVVVAVVVVVVVGVLCLLSHMFMYLFNLCVFTFFFTQSLAILSKCFY